MMSYGLECRIKLIKHDVQHGFTCFLLKLSFVNLLMAKLLKILTLILIPVFLNSTALLTCFSEIDIVLSVIEATSFETALDGENNEQNEEQNEGESDFWSGSVINHKCYLQKDICFQNNMLLLPASIIDCYSPPPEINI